MSVSLECRCLSDGEERYRAVCARRRYRLVMYINRNYVGKANAKHWRALTKIYCCVPVPASPDASVVTLMSTYWLESSKLETPFSANT